MPLSTGKKIEAIRTSRATDIIGFEYSMLLLANPGG